MSVWLHRHELSFTLVILKLHNFLTFIISAVYARPLPEATSTNKLCTSTRSSQLQVTDAVVLRSLTLPLYM